MLLPPTGLVALHRRGDDVELEAPFGAGTGRPEGGAYVYGAVTDLAVDG